VVWLEGLVVVVGGIFQVVEVVVEESAVGLAKACRWNLL
jgi:hypothetical protein